jgi:hypothetical protein
VVDSLILMSFESNNERIEAVPARQKNIMNFRKRIVKKMRSDKLMELRLRVVLNVEIKNVLRKKNK